MLTKMGIAQMYILSAVVFGLIENIICLMSLYFLMLDDIREQKRIKPDKYLYLIILLFFAGFFIWLSVIKPKFSI